MPTPTDTDDDGVTDTAGGKGRKVRLTTDPTQSTFDKYKRLLAYVDTSSEQLNVSQIAAGWSKTYVYGKRFRQYSRFKKAAKRAKEDQRGVWWLCEGDFQRTT